MGNILEICLTRPLIWAGFSDTIEVTCLAESWKSAERANYRKAEHDVLSNIQKIDCHTHIFTEEIRREYFSRTEGLALVMQMPESILANPDCIATVTKDERLFLCPCIDLKRPIPPQLAALEPHLDEYKAVGLKIYLSYQAGTAADPPLDPVYQFARKHRLSVTFHTGLCSLVLPSDNDLDGSSARHIALVAERYPDVNFILAHMDDPHFEQCVELVAKHDNMFTDVSGAYETGTKEGNDVQGAIDLFCRAVRSQPGMERKILYGTDFCPPIQLAQLEEYDETIRQMFAPEHFDLVYRQNCLRAFPRLAEFLQKQNTAEREK